MTAAAAGLLAVIASAQTVSVPSAAALPSKRFIGHYAGGLQLQISASGTVDLYSPSNYLTYPDGSLAAPFSGPVITWANAGDSYPTFAGGDGINHYPGGGTNWQGTVFNSLGAQSTDTTNPATVRFGTLVGTFKDNPSAADWFIVGSGTTVTTPAIGGRLYLAVTDCPSCEGDNTGAYSATMEGSALAPFNLADQFTEASNPNGPWSYGFKLASEPLGTFTAFADHYAGYLGTLEGRHGFSQTGSDLPGISYNRSNVSNQDPYSEWLPGEVNVHPGTVRDCVVRFTAPSAGTLRVGGWLRGLSFAGTSSGAILYYRGQSIFATSVLGHGTVVPVPYQTLEFLAGEPIDLVITKGPNNTYASDSTGVNLLIAPAPPAIQAAAVTLLGGSHLRADSAATIAPQQFTLEAWFRPDGPGLGFAGDSVGAAIINKPAEGQTGSNLASWGLHWSSGTNRVFFYLSHVYGSSGIGVFSNATIPIGTVAHCAGTFDGSTLRLYINGLLDSSVVASSPNVSYADHMPVLIGASNFGVGYSRTFEGLLDGVRIWGRARTAGEIAGTYSCSLQGSQADLLAAWNFDGSTLIDASGNGRFATPATSSSGGIAFVAQPGPGHSLCPADADCSGTLAIADIFYFLNIWFAGNSSADFDGLNGLQIADIFAFLNAWFAGCP
jgi:hypothetical protein